MMKKKIYVGGNVVAEYRTKKEALRYMLQLQCCMLEGLLYGSICCVACESV